MHPLHTPYTHVQPHTDTYRQTQMHKVCINVNAHTKKTHWCQHIGLWSTEKGLWDMNIPETEETRIMVALKLPVGEGGNRAGQHTSHPWRATWSVWTLTLQKAEGEHMKRRGRGYIGPAGTKEATR